MYKKSLFLAILLAVIAVIIVWGIQKSDRSSEVIKIGVIAPITGGASGYGATLAKGVEMAFADLSDEKTKYRYELIIEDDATNQAQAASAASKLIHVNKVRALITTTSGTGNAVKNIAAEAGVTHVCDCTDISIGDTPYNFTNGITPEDEIPVWLAEAQRREVKTVAILDQVNPGIKALVDELIKKAPEYGIKIVHRQSFDGGYRDFKTIIAKAQQTKPDLYYVGAFPPSLDIISRQMIDGGIKHISTTGLFAISPEPSLYEGLWYSDSMLSDHNMNERFVKENPTLRFNTRTVPYGYDIFTMLVQSFETEGDPNENLKAITKYEGTVGTVTKHPSSRNFHTPGTIWMIKNGKAVQL